jgi:hypothetical protein
MNPEVCLIGGCGSSGTTLLAHLLDCIGDLRCSPEAFVFHHRALYGASDFKRELYRSLAQLGPRLVFEVDGLNHSLVHPIFISARSFFGMWTLDDEYDLYSSVGSIAELVEHLKKRMQKRHGFPHPFLWVDQTPKNALVAPLFLSSLRGAKFIHLIRDGRDVAASLAKRYAHELPHKSRDTYLKVGALRWCYDVSRALMARGMPGYLEVRYEELTTDPLGTVNLILRHLEREEIDAAGLERKRSYAAESFPFAFLGGPKPSWGASPTEPVTPRSVGSWRRELSGDELALLSEAEFNVEGAGPLRFSELLGQLAYR